MIRDSHTYSFTATSPVKVEELIAALERAKTIIPNGTVMVNHYEGDQRDRSSTTFTVS